MRQTAFQTPFGFTLTPWVKRILIANVAVFILTSVDQEFFFRWFAFTPAEVLTRPWGAVTYMFLHGNFWHLFFNMVVLFFFGPPLESRWGPSEFLRFYFICGLGGVALSFLFASASIIGASAAIYGLMMAFALYWPNSLIYIWGILPIKAKWLVGILFGMSLMNAVGGGGDGIAHLAHLGGLLTGFLYLKSDWRPGAARKRTHRGVQIRRFAIVPREEPADQAGSGKSSGSERSATDDSILDEVDRILDKISAHGMASLTPKERKTLDEVSRRRRSN